MSVTSTVKSALGTGATAVSRDTLLLLASVPPLRYLAVRTSGAVIRYRQGRARTDPARIAGVVDDQKAMGLALLHMIERGLQGPLAPAVRRAIVCNLLQGILLKKGRRAVVNRFRAEHNDGPPGLLVISPGKACNLHCTGCYADSGTSNEKLEWGTFDRIVDEALTQWGARFFVISGGEPLAYRSEGKGLLEIAEKYPQCYFLMYTNGTLIDDAMAKRLAAVGNVTPAISVEGWRERTDARRGAGVFDQVLATMARLRMAGVPFGISLTATRENAEEILSDEFLNYFFETQGALYGWLFQYMPIGRSFTLELMPTPEQRVWMWHRTWEIIRERRLFLPDFWNSATASFGCIAAGRANGGGYLYIDWNGAVSPCVFVPYSPVNIREIYAQGKTLNDVWAEPFFSDIRQWQAGYADAKGNWLSPCINRDHHSDLCRLIATHEPEPMDANAREALLDPNYAAGLATYDATYGELSQEIWDSAYLRPDGSGSS